MNKQLISMSVYGTKPMYYEGAKRNTELWKVIYPDFDFRIYIEEGLDYSWFENRGVQIKVCKKSQLHSGMFWRFLAIWDYDYDHVIFRDSDSRFNIREEVAVRAWIKSGKSAHSIHDHPHHRGAWLMGGMWGIKPGAIEDRLKKKVVRSIRNSQDRVLDMDFLRRIIHPLIKDSLLRHSSFESPKWEAEPFPEHPYYNGFVGEQFDEKDRSISVVIK